MPSTTGMMGEGFYDRHSSAQAAAIGQVLDWLRESASALPLPPAPKPVVLLDLGSSEGRNAVQTMRVIVETLRQRTAQPIETVYSDLPTNNFNQLFANLAAQESAPEVYAAASAGSFYGRLVPEASVHLATCFNSLLWLDHLPDAGVPDFVCYRRPLPPRPRLDVPAATAAAFAARAEDDLVRFLSARAREIVPGGKLILATPADDAHSRCCDGLYDVLDDACRDLVADGRIDRARYERFVIPVYFRTLEEWQAGVAQEPVRGLFAVDHAETLEVPTPFEEEYGRTGDATAHAAAMAGFLRAFSEPIARAGLLGPESPPGVMDALYGRVRERLEREPKRYPLRYVQVGMALTRR